MPLTMPQHLENLVRRSSSKPTVCDHCDEAVHRDENGWWVGADETSDCTDNDTGHEVDGDTR